MRWFVAAVGCAMALGASSAWAADKSGGVVHTLCPEAVVLASYDTDHDGVVTRQELKDGLRHDFERLDTDHTGKLTAEQVRAENSRRRKTYGTRYSPIIDSNNDGVVTFEEFAMTITAEFDQFDKNGDGQVKGDELIACGVTVSPAESKAKVKAPKRPKVQLNKNTGSTDTPVSTSQPAASPAQN